MDSMNVSVKNGILPKRRGRPRKNMLDNESNMDKKKSNVFKTPPQELILHLAINSESDTNKKEKNNFAITEVEQKGESDETDDIDSVKNVIKTYKTELLEKDKIIKKIKDELIDYKNMVGSNLTTKEIKYSSLNINLINCKNGTSIVEDTTNIACWWCTYEFESLPFFIPENEVNNIFYVFGCFCSPQCATSYNETLNDYKTKERYSLIKKLSSLITGNNSDIVMAPPKEVLKKYGGTLTIEEYRKICFLNNKEMKIRMPPLHAIVPILEEKPKDKKINSDKQIMIKPLQNQQKNIFSF
jgi:hypothetical protein